MSFWHEGEHQKAHSRARFCARRKTLKTTSAQNTKKSFFWLLQLLDEGLTRLWQLEGTCLRTLRAYTGWWYIYKVECLHRICFFSTLRVLRDQKKPGQSKYHRNKDVARPKPISKVSGREWPYANARAHAGEGTWHRTLPAHNLRTIISKVSGREWPYANARARAGEGT